MQGNQFGHFDPSGRAFTIVDAATPMPWVNVVCNGRLGFVVSQNGGGFSWLDDAQHNVLTRWEMDLVRDCYGKFLYASDLESGEVWSLAPAPCRPKYERYSCTHALGSSTFETTCHGTHAKWTMAVAPADQIELWVVELTNTTDRARRLRIASYFEWTCGAAPDVKREFHRLFFKTDYDAARKAIFATKVMWDIRPKSEREHWNKPWPYHAAHSIGWGKGTTPDREIAIGDKSAFLGRYGATHAPAAMSGATPKSGGFGRFGDAAASLGGEVVIQPGQTIKLHYTIAIGATRAEVESLVTRYADSAAVAAAVAAAGDAWEHRLSATKVESEQRDFDLLNNHWLPYQAISGRMWGRTGYYQQSGAFGFRDQLQDSQVWLPLEPRRTLDQIMMHAERQFADGSVYHWWHALADFGNHTACSDDYLWLPFVVSAYLRETGDFGALQRTARFVDDAKATTLLDHCKRAIARTFKRTSERGLPHIGSCDWNDGLSAMGIDEKGESVWVGMFLCEILDDWAVIMDAAGEAGVGAEYRKKREEYAGAINELAWEGEGTVHSSQFTVHSSQFTVHMLNGNGSGEKVQSTKHKAQMGGNGSSGLLGSVRGAGGVVGVGGLVGAVGNNGASGGDGGEAAAGGWYRYGTKDSGEWIGAAGCAEGKVHLNAQTWSILADVAPEERARAAWATVKQRLLSPYGPLLLWPAYTEPDPTIGYITRYSPGSRENGGVYMHAATWALAAACKLKDAEAVSRIWKSISPPVRGADAESYWAEPYVTPGNVDGPLSDKPGRAGWTWYTGSAAWLNRVSLEWMLGIRPVFLELQAEHQRHPSPCPLPEGGGGDSTGLLIDPCPPVELGRVNVMRTWRGHRVRVSFDAAEFAQAMNADTEPRAAADGAHDSGELTADSRRRLRQSVEPVLTVNGRTVEGRVLTESMLAGAGGAAGTGGRGIVDVVVSWARAGAAGVSSPAGQRHASSQPGRA